MVQSETKTVNVKCYLVVAYRWGWINNHQYFVGCWLDKDTAIAFAVQECYTCGGKYGVTVYELCGQQEQEVHHSPSSYGEEHAHLNHRIQLFERFGNRFVPLLEDMTSGDLSREAMIEFIDREKKILAIFEETKN